MLKINGFATVVANAEVKWSNEKTKRVEVRVASNRSVKDGENWVEKPTFTVIKFWAPINSKIDSFLTKGSKVAFSGDLVQEDSWTDKDGNRRSGNLIIEANHQDLIPVRKQAPASDQAPASNQAPAQAPAPTAEQSIPEVDIDDDEIPF
jgi:single-strand DNA-binding protein